MHTESLAGIVRPRVFDSRSKGGDPVLLEEVVATLLANRARGSVLLQGSAGSGKSTALRFLAAVFAGHPVLRLVDGARIGHSPAAGPEALVIRASEFVDAPFDMAELRLVPWGRDEVIEYLLAHHHDRCGELLRRFEQCSDAASHAGNPELVCLTLEAMALQDDVSDVATAIRRRFAATTGDRVEREKLGRQCWLHQVAVEGEPWKPVNPLLRLKTVRNVLGADALAHEWESHGAMVGLEAPIPYDTWCALVVALRASPPAAKRLVELAEDPSAVFADKAIELMNGVDVHAVAQWIESRRHRALPLPALEKLWLPGLDLTGLPLASLRMKTTHLDGARLSGCDLSLARLGRSRLNGANLSGAVLLHAHAIGAQFERADLSGCDAEGAHGEGANLRGANLRVSRFTRAVLPFACLESADLSGADFSGADLTQANVESARLVDVDFSHARLDGVKLRLATLASRSFADASLENAWLEGVVLDGACFSGANLKRATLTGSRMRHAKFEGASLESAGLADVDWEGADLHGANLKHASFHMGSSRSGLVFHASPMEGSRTGFYSDEFLHAGYKAPEEIRKANLCRTDLRGAQIFDTDFYLVDLRGAQYDADQELHLRRCGAILDDWATR